MRSHRLKLALAFIVTVALVVFFTRRHSLPPSQDAKEVASSTDQLPSLATNVARTVPKQKPVRTVDDAPETNQPPAPTFEEIVRFVSDLRTRQFGDGKPLSAEEREWLEQAKPYLKEIQKSPEQFAALQTSLIQSGLGLQDSGRLLAIQEVIQNVAQEAIALGVMYSSDPQNESDSWKKQRYDLDRKATHAVQAILGEADRAMFDRRFLGAMIMDLTPGHWDPSFEFIDPSLRATRQQPGEPQ